MGEEEGGRRGKVGYTILPEGFSGLLRRKACWRKKESRGSSFLYFLISSEKKGDGRSKRRKKNTERGGSAPEGEEDRRVRGWGCLLAAKKEEYSSIRLEGGLLH